MGLAAPQIGESTRVVVINLNPNKAEPTLVLVNPIITSETGKKDKKKESCMSVPAVRGQVERRENVEVQYQAADGSQRTMRASGFLARVICHEIDHLEGRLYINRMPSGSPLEKVDFFDDEAQYRCSRGSARCAHDSPVSVRALAVRHPARRDREASRVM